MGSTNILLRISEDEKAQIKAAADVVGTTLTRFVVQAALKRAARTSMPNDGVRSSMPAWFRAICSAAAQGGSTGYDAAGYKLAASLATSAPNTIDGDEWQREIRRLKEEVLAQGDRKGIWMWMQYHYPKLMELVPPRRKEQLVDGVIRAYQRGEF